jgi:signal peptidase I
MSKAEETTLNFNYEEEDKKKKRKKAKKDKTKMTVFDVLEPIVAALLAITIIFTLFLRIVNVSGPSMMPTLNNGDKILISARGYEPKVGDIVVLSGASGIKETIVKRIIALGGDQVDINFTTGVVTVNGIEEEYAEELTLQQFDIAFPITVPEGCVFVLGDNRSDSLDSRSTEIGCIDERYIVGKVIFSIVPFGKVE